MAWTTPTGSTLRPFQEDGVRMLHRTGGRGLLADEVGLGKTLEAYYYVWKYVPADPPGPVVVVVPAHLRVNWRRELKKHFGVRCEILYHRGPAPEKQPPDDPNQTYIINYDILVPPHWKARTPPPESSWLAWLRRLNPRAVIADEGHYLSNPSAARTRAVKRLVAGTPHALVLTGTPMTNKPPGLWSLLNIVRPALFPSRLQFCLDYTHATKHWYGWEFRGGKDLDLLHRILKRNHVMVRRRKADVLKDLPAVQRTVVEVPVDLAEYRKAEESFLDWLSNIDPDAGRRAAKAEQVSKLGHLKRLAGRLKVDPVCAWVSDFLQESDGKILLGGLHYGVTEAVVAAFPGQSVLVDGRVPPTDRQALFDRFNTNPRCRVFVGNVHAAGTGWSCTSTSDEGLIELPWNPGDVAQFEGRIDGIERGIPGTAAHVRFFVARGTVEEDLCQVLQRKAGWADMVIDGGSGETDLDLYDQVVALMKRRKGAKACARKRN